MFFSYTTGMGRYLTEIVVFIFLILMSVNSAELPRQPFEFKTFKPEIQKYNLNSYQDDSTQLPIVTNDNFFSDYGSDSNNIKGEANSIINTDVISKETKKNFPNENKISNMKKKLSIFKNTAKSKIQNPPEKLSKKFPITSDNGEFEIIQPQLGVRWPLLSASEELPFGHTWQKYFEHSIESVFPFPELDMNKNAWRSGVEKMVNRREDNDKIITYKSNLFESELRSDSKKVIFESGSLESSSQYDDEPSKSPEVLPLIKNEERNQEIKKAKNHLQPQGTINQPHQFSRMNASDLFQMHLNHTKKPALHFLVKQQSRESDGAKSLQTDATDNNENPTHSSQQKLSDGKLKYQSAINEHVSDSIDLPWQQHTRRRHYEPIMPFPELHEAGFRHQVEDIKLEQDNASQKGPLSFMQEQRTPEIAGPLLYPQSSFEKEFQVPFF